MRSFDHGWMWSRASDRLDAGFVSIFLLFAVGVIAASCTAAPDAAWKVVLVAGAGPIVAISRRKRVGWTTATVNDVGVRGSV